MGALRKLSPSFTASVLLHAALLLFWGYTVTQTHLADRARESKYIRVEVDPLPQALPNVPTKNQVVQTEKVPKTKEATPDAFLGEQAQRVDHQVVSVPKTGTAPKVT